MGFGFFAGTLGDRKKFTEGGLLITLSSLLCLLFFLYFEAGSLELCFLSPPSHLDKKSEGE